MCLIEANIKRLKDDLAEQKRVHSTFDAVNKDFYLLNWHIFDQIKDIRRRFDTFEHKVIGNLAIINNQPASSK